MKNPIVKADKSAQEFPLQNDTIAFLQERIADGGATTDHLQVMLDKLKPKDEEQH